MRNLTVFSLLLIPIILITGCARYPSTISESPAPARTLYCEMTVRGKINPNYFYFLAIGVDQTNTTGPVPVVTGYGYTNGWGTIAPLPAGEDPIEPPFYVQYHNTFEQVREGQSLLFPYRYGVTDDGKTLWVEIDQSLLEPLLGNASSPIIQLNWITMKNIDPQLGEGDVKEYDGFGPQGNNYLDTVTLHTSRTWISGEDGVPEEPAYGVEERTASDPDIDITNWRVDVRIRSTNSTSTSLGVR